MYGTDAGCTFSSNTGSLNVAMSTISSVKVVSGLDGSGVRAVEMTELINWVTAGPMRTALVEPVMRAIFLTVGEEAMLIEFGLIWNLLGREECLDNAMLDYFGDGGEGASCSNNDRLAWHSTRSPSPSFAL